MPVSVTAFSGASLEQRGYQSITDIQQSTPNLIFTPGTGGTSSQVSAYIRGVGEYDYIVTSDPAVAVFIDGVYQARPFGAITSLLGIDRIEVLRGPQGSLFGKNTIGGAISIITRRPEGTGTGEVDLKVGSYATAQLRGSYDGRLGSDGAYAVSLLARRADGWQRLDQGGSLGNQQQMAGRVALRWRPDGLDAILSVDALHQRQNSAAHSMIAFTPTFFSQLYSNFVTPCCTVPSSIRRTQATPLLNVDNADGVNSSLTLAFAALGGEVKSITGLRYTDVLFARDGDASFEANYAGDRQQVTATQVSQELQFTHSLFDGRARTLLGLYGFYERARQRTLLVTAYGLYPRLLAAGFDPALAAALDFNIDFDLVQKTTNGAIFGNVTIDVTDALSLDVGGRLTYERKRFTSSANRVFANLPLIPGVPSFRLDDSWTNFSPKVTANYRLSDDVMAYATFSQGFRSGGFNGRPTAAAEIGGFDPEKLTSYEAGFKSEFADRRVRLNASLFYNRYRNMQVLVTFPGANGLIVARTENAGRARIWGFEAEAQVRAADWLTFDGSVGYLNARYLEYFSRDAFGNLIDYSDLKLRHTPPWSGNLGVTTLFPVGAAQGRLRVDAGYQDAQFIDVQNTPLLRAEPNVVLNARASVTLGNGVELAVEGQNLTDKQVIREGFDGRSVFGFAEAYYSPPRRIFGSIGYKF